MSQENVDVVRDIYERWSEGDFRASVEVLDPFVLFVMRPEFPDAGAYLGVERLAGYMRGFLDPWTHISMEAEEMAVAGDSVVVAVLQRGVGSGSGAETELRYFHVWSFRGGKVIRLESFRGRAEAFQAVGLRD